MPYGAKVQCDLACGLASAARHVLSLLLKQSCIEEVFADLWLYPESSVCCEEEKETTDAFFKPCGGDASTEARAE